MKVIVVTQPKLGWDNIIGIFSSEMVSYEELNNMLPDEDYVFHELEVQYTLEEL